MSSSWRQKTDQPWRQEAGPSNRNRATQNWRLERFKSFIAGEDNSESWRNESSEPSKKEKSESWKEVRNKGPQRRKYEFKQGSLGRTDFADVSFIKKLLDKYNSEEIIKYLIVNLDEYKKVVNDNLSIELVFSLTELNAKVCSSTSVLDKYRILSLTVNKEFVTSWNKTLSTIAVENTETVWKNIQNNLDNILLIYENSLDLMPSHCWHLIKSTLTLFDINISFIQLKCPSDIFTNFNEKLILLRENVQFCENRFSKKKVVEQKEPQEELLPEDDYRGISIFPTARELVIKERNFVRKNVAIGAYKDIAHYLDVQFRLQREDFLNPIREDLSDYLNNINRHFFNIKIYEEVTVVERVICKDQISFKIAIKMNKYMENRFQDKSKKKFLNNSLLIFTDDDFETIFCGLVANSDHIGIGELTVAFEQRLPILKRKYKMVECIVFFEPYYHVMKILKILSHETLPMSKYIIDVQTSIERPNYLKSLKARISSRCLNESQIKAFQGALDQEFVVIQGPPGTGKTFLGLSITGNLLRYSKGPVLVVCYTNHALDQFLEGLLKYTNKIVRLGSQSKSEKLKEHSLQKMRRAANIKIYAENDLDSSESYIRELDNVLLKLQKPPGVFQYDLIFTRTRIDLENSCFSYFTDECFMVWLLQDTNNDLAAAERDLERLRYIYQNYLSGYIRYQKLNYNNKWGILIPNEVERCLHDIQSSMHSMKKEIKTVYDDYQKGEMDEETYNSLMAYYNENLDWFAKDSGYIKTKLELLKKQLNKTYDDPPALETIEDPFSLPIEVRWQIYNNWLKDVKTYIRLEKDNQITIYRYSYGYFNLMMNYANVETMKSMKVIGMTTSCAARMHDVLRRVRCPVVVVEEAAEVLETHIITLLTEDCEHLILLGDHQQLKPSTSDYVLEKQYNLGISLFERMVKNKIQCHTLNVQHRMRKEIASLISPVIYPDLQNHPSVLEYPEIRGVKKSLYFIDHKNTEEEFGDSSKFNQFEAEYLPKLAEYFLINGYCPENITILTAYLGQEAVIKKEIAKLSYRGIENINVTCVDNFQGEENKIILLSLVRNNREGTVGFLSIENRICVALSRAREGLFVMGNMSQLCKASEIWRSIRTTLTSLEAVGPSLPLVCTTHGNLTYIKELKDFQTVAKGGCNMDCEKKLDCGHTCKEKCHPHHLYYRCPEVCNKKLCKDLSHGLCKKLCWQECERCNRLISVTLTCGHEREVPCYIKNKLNAVMCQTKESVNLPCDHSYEKFCHEAVDTIKCNIEEKVILPCGHSMTKKCFEHRETLKCQNDCNTLLTCGHNCLEKCHHLVDPKHERRYFCNVICDKENLDCQSQNKHTSKVLCIKNAKSCTVTVKKFKKGCGHLCNILCREDINATKCLNPCRKKLSCGHQCSKLCWETCNPCKKETPFRAECRHWQLKFCGISETGPCRKFCQKVLPCGHVCHNLCGEPCNILCTIKLDCGHYCRAKYGETGICILCNEDANCVIRGEVTDNDKTFQSEADKDEDEDED